MKKLMTLGIIAISFNLGLSAELYNNVIIRDFPIDAQEDLQHHEHHILGKDGAGTRQLIGSDSATWSPNANERIQQDMRKPQLSELAPRSNFEKSSELIQADSNIEANPEQHEETMFSQQGPIYLTIGKSTKIGLPYTFGTGYSWIFSCSPDNALEVTSDYEKKNNLAGAKGTQVFTIKAKQAGKIMCTFENKRSGDVSYTSKKTQAFIITE